MLYPPEVRLQIEAMADGLGENFVGSHFEKKWFSEYYIDSNNRAFLEHLAELDDSLDKIYKTLFQQLEDYKERTPVESHLDIFNATDVIVKRWLSHTRFICRKAIKEYKDELWVEVYNEAMKWCDWKIVQIDTRHGLNYISDTAQLRKIEVPVPLSTALPQVSDEPELTQRERVLIRCYKQQPAISRGQEGYQDYMTYARAGDRCSYPGDSDRKAKSLIRSIQKVLPYLTDAEKEQAVNEIDTIQAKFRNQL